MAKRKDPPPTFIFAVDSETSGLYFGTGSDDPSTDSTTGEYYQALSWGIIVLEAATLKEVERLYVEVKWDGKALWEKKAEAVHGLTKSYLEKNGVDEEDAMVDIANLVIKYWGTTGVITLGHNVATFDVPFLRAAMRRHGIELKFGNRHIDTCSAGIISLKAYNSDELFEAVALDARGTHNAMEDIEMTVEAARRMRMVFESALDAI